MDMINKNAKLLNQVNELPAQAQYVGDLDRAKVTKRLYAGILRRLARYLTRNNLSFEGLTNKDIDVFLEYHKEAQRSIARAALKSYYSYITDKEIPHKIQVHKITGYEYKRKVLTSDKN